MVFRQAARSDYPDIHNTFAICVNFNRVSQSRSLVAVSSAQEHGRGAPLSRQGLLLQTVGTLARKFVLGGHKLSKRTEELSDNKNRTAMRSVNRFFFPKKLPLEIFGNALLKIPKMSGSGCANMA